MCIPAVSQISNFTVASSNVTVCVKKAATGKKNVYFVRLRERSNDAGRNRQKDNVRLTSDRGLLKLKELVPDKSHHQTRLPYCRIPQQNQLEMTNTVGCHRYHLLRQTRFAAFPLNDFSNISDVDFGRERNCRTCWCSL